MCDTSMAYENRNQIESKPIKLHALSGLASDDQGIPIPNICLGVFSDNTHRIVAVTKTSEDGRFSFDKIGTGQYRLVAKHPLLCTANVSLVLSHPSTKPKRDLRLHMRPSGIDRCSYGELATLQERYSVTAQSYALTTHGPLCTTQSNMRF